MALSEAARTTDAARFPWGRVLGLLALLVAGVAAAFLAGFCRFAQTVTSAEPPENARADAIVALTGGASRIQDALQLLADGRGRRLLITGVNPATSRRELLRHVPGSDPLFDCCVDLDWRAMNTIGNAEETRKWAERRGFRSLIVVTSAYHVPRSMAELNRVLPGVELIAYPVPVERLHGPWWRDAPMARLLLGEYVKYIAAVARMSLEPIEPGIRPTQTAFRAFSD
jgi:uncharacterized SAM-binding protein YcdF (DUF218 family)